MQLFYQRFSVQEYLLFTLLGITALVLLTNFIGQEAAENTTDWILITLSAIVMVFSVFMASKYGLKGNHGKAWVLFMLFSAYWLCAETIDVFYEVALGSQPWDYADDFFYITGYQLFFASLVFYLKPFSKQISKKSVLGISIISMFLLIPSLIMVLDSKPDVVNNNLLVLLSYPFLDSVILVPALIGVVLFFKGSVNFMMSLLFLGIITHIVGDNAVLYLTLQNTYYSGHLVGVLFMWTYTMFAFGIFNQKGLFNSNSERTYCCICGNTCLGHD